MGQAENVDVEPEGGKSPNVDQSLGVWRGLRNHAVQGFSAASQGVSPWGCAGRGLVGVVAAAHLPPTGQAIAGHRHGPWKGLSFYSPDICLLEAFPSAGGAELLPRLASVLEMRAQSL